MILYGTPRSHFTRKVRILINAIDIVYDFVDIGDVSRSDTAMFKGTPLMCVPVLDHGSVRLWESDHIAAYLSGYFDPEDRLRVRVQTPDDLNIRATLNGIMSNEVKLVLGQRTGLQTQGQAYFDKARSAISGGLNWLERHADFFTPDTPGYAEFHFIAMWDHLALYETVQLDYAQLNQIASHMHQNPIVKTTAYPPLP